MKNPIPLYVYGLLLSFAGIFLFCKLYDSFGVLKLTLGIGVLVGSFFAFITAITNNKRKGHFAYHEIHALTLLAFGIAILFFCDSLVTLIHYTTFLFFFYSFSEIIFCIWLFNLRQHVVYSIIFARLIIGMLTGIGTVIAMYYVGFEKETVIMIFGVLFIAIGVNVILYLPVMKRINQPESARKTLNSSL